jgi:CheY-like chemotaxis protein
MDEGGTLDVRAEVEDSMVRLTFSDTGNGMTEEVLEKIYDPFFTTKSEKGTGLGLSLVRGIILRHHGEMDVDSTPEKGTTFSIRLPLYEGAEEVEPIVAEPVATPVPAEAGDEPGDTLRVLVVDDEPEMRGLFGEILQRHGYEAVTAGSGAEAIRILDEGNSFQVVIADLGMPEMSGWDVIAQARKLLTHARFIITTGWGDSFVDVDLKARGVDHILPKPVEVQSLVDLMEHIRATLEASSPAEAAQARSTS